MQFITNGTIPDRGVEACAKRVVALLGSGYEPTHLVLDAHDYASRVDVLEEFKDFAFSWTPDRPKDHVPAYLLDVMRESSCLNLVWLSPRTIASGDHVLSWITAHELRHVYQSRNCCTLSNLRNAIRSLRRDPKFLALPPNLFDPAEMDSELCALQTVANLYWNSDLSQAAAQIALPRYPFPAYNQFLLELHPHWLN